MNEIKAGDVVQLKSGGMKMTVSRITQFGLALCQWFDTGTSSIKSSEINPIALTKVSE
jgi:uncharacterized protein YodC (DUF2158 family)